MPEMTKQEPEPESTGAARTDGHTGDENCPKCNHPEKDHVDPMPGTRRWFWRKRAENLLLIIGPLIPGGTALGAMWKPTVTTPLTDKQEAAINGVYEYAPGAKASTVHEVVVRIDHPGIGDRLVAAGPSLAFAVLLGLLAYALWRIEINMSGNRRPYTEKDQRVFSRAIRWVWTGWWVVFGLELLGGLWYHYGPSGGWFRAGAHVPLDGLSIVILGLSGILYVVSRMYRTGRKAYEELEKAV